MLLFPAYVKRSGEGNYNIAQTGTVIVLEQKQELILAENMM